MPQLDYNIKIEAATEDKAKEIGNALYTLYRKAQNKEDLIFFALKVAGNPDLLRQAKTFLLLS